jgi:hypothetical protein
MDSKNKVPSLSLGLPSRPSQTDPLQKQFGEDGVAYVHGTNSSAFTAISESGLVPVGKRLKTFARSQGMPFATPEDRQKVADSFAPGMQSGERGFTLEAWVKDRKQPIAKGISVFDASKASGTGHYARQGTDNTDLFPVVLGIGHGVNATTPRGVGHPVVKGSIAPDDIPVVYVPSGRSDQANQMLDKTPLRKRAKSFPDLFKS